jgi:transposase InsO family protein
VSNDDLVVMRRLDEQYLVTPFYGVRRMAAALRRDGLVVNRQRIRRLMRVIGIEAIYQKPNMSRRHPQHTVYPYLLRSGRIKCDALSVDYHPSLCTKRPSDSGSIDGRPSPSARCCGESQRSLSIATR